MSPDELEKIVPALKIYSNKITLSGGEPLEYRYLPELLLLLTKHGFDVSVNTYLPSLPHEAISIDDIVKRVTSVHLSVPDIHELAEVESKITKLRNSCRTLQIVLNVPITSIEDLKDRIGRLYEMCRKANARMQLIQLFDIKNTRKTTWEQRWKDVIATLGFLELSFLECTNREISYVTQDLVQIDLLDVPCRASGIEFGDGKCLAESDITIDPNLRLSICRWSEKAVVDTKDSNVEDIIRETFRLSCSNCRHGTIRNYTYPDSIESYMALPHYKWPPLLDESVEKCNILLQNSELSYYGKSGYISQLENEFAGYFGAPYAFAASSGTVAVYLACVALGLTSEDEIIVPAYTFPTVVTAIISTGAKIRVCDSESNTGNLSISSFKQHINPKVKAVLVTHLWGDPVELDELLSICKKNNIRIIEDCSHAYGASYKNRLVGTFGDIACFSTQANKTVFSGEGGLLITSSPELYERTVVFASSNKRILDSVYGNEYRRYWESGLGLKLKMHPLGAPIALESLRSLNNTNVRRNMRASIINRALTASQIINAPRHNETDTERVYYTYKPYLRQEWIHKRDELVERLILQGLDVSASSFIPLHKTPLMKHKQILNNDDKFIDADIYCNRIISFPAFVNEPVELVELYAKKLSSTLSDILEKEICTNFTKLTHDRQLRTAEQI